MARTRLAAVAPNVLGVTAALAGPPTAEGDMLRPDEVLWVHNGNAATLTVTLVTGGTADSLAVADPTVSIPTGTDKIIGPFGDVFPQPSGADRGYVYVDYSVQSSVTRVALASW